jgi:hypothetical protein
VRGAHTPGDTWEDSQGWCLQVCDARRERWLAGSPGGVWLLGHSCKAWIFPLAPCLMRGCLPRASAHNSLRGTCIHNILCRISLCHPLCGTAARTSCSPQLRSHRPTQAATRSTCVAVSMDGAAGAASAGGGSHNHNSGRHKKHKQEGGYQGKLLTLKLTPAEATAASRARTLHLCGWDVEGVSVAGEVRQAGLCWA